MKPSPASSMTMLAVTTSDGSIGTGVAATPTARVVARNPPATWE
jgi:hypothetical protein